MNGTLYAVGVGPGAPDLLTLRAARVLGGVDVILAAASPRNDYSAALETARPHLRADARILRREFPMTREEAPLRAAWRAAAESTLEVLGAGEDAAFLTIGDPLVYSTFGYLLRTVRAMAPDAFPASRPFRRRPPPRRPSSAKGRKACTSCRASGAAKTWPRSLPGRTRRSSSRRTAIFRPLPARSKRRAARRTPCWRAMWNAQMRNCAGA